MVPFVRGHGHRSRDGAMPWKTEAEQRARIVSCPCGWTTTIGEIGGREACPNEVTKDDMHHLTAAP